MHSLDSMLDKIKQTRSLASDNALAKFLGVSRQRVSSWRNGERLPDEVSCARIADEAGVPLARVLGLIGEARAISKEAKEVWRRLATAAVLTMATLGALARPADVSAAQRSQNFLQEPGLSSVYIMRNLRRWIRRIRRATATGAQMIHLLKAKIQGAVGPLTPDGKATSAQVLCTC